VYSGFLDQRVYGGRDVMGWRRRVQTPSIPSNWEGASQARGPQEQQGKKILGITINNRYLFRIIYAIVQLVHVGYTGKIVNQLWHFRHAASVTGYNSYMYINSRSNFEF